MRDLKVRYYLKNEKKNKHGESAIYCFIGVNKTSTTLFTGRYINSNRWKETNMLTKTNMHSEKAIHDYLYIRLKPKIVEKYNQLVLSGQELFDATELKRQFDENSNGVYKVGITVVAAFKEHNNMFKQAVNKGFKSRSSLEKYERIFKYFLQFLEENYNMKDIPLKNLDRAKIRAFYNYLLFTKEYRGKNGMGHNSAVKYMRNFQTVIKYTIKNSEELVANPMSFFDETILDNDPIYLTESELKVIQSIELKSERMIKVRDIFVFGCLTGLAPCDLHRLNSSNITETEDGIFIDIRRKKTGVLSHIPLLQPAIDILDKYKNHPICVKNGSLLPLMSNPVFNRYLKELADLCKIQKNIHMYAARHTFATYMLNKNVSLPTIARMMGHKNIRKTQEYARLMNAKVDKEIKEIFSKIE